MTGKYQALACDTYISKQLSTHATTGSAPLADRPRPRPPPGRQTRAQRTHWAAQPAGPRGTALGSQLNLNLSQTLNLKSHATRGSAPRAGRPRPRPPPGRQTRSQRTHWAAQPAGPRGTGRCCWPSAGGCPRQRQCSCRPFRWPASPRHTRAAPAPQQEKDVMASTIAACQKLLCLPSMLHLVHRLLHVSGAPALPAAALCAAG